MSRFASTVLALVVVSPAALAYSELVHEMLPARAFADKPALLSEAVHRPDDKALAEFRKFVYEGASHASDAELRAAFVHRYPTLESFDAYAFKEFMMMDPAKEVYGIDRVGAERTAGDVLANGSRYPDADRRNQDRFLRDMNRQVVKDAWGQEVPYDPAILSMGNRTGVSSQAHAHYQLLPPPLSDDPDMLKNDPAHFSIPKNVKTWGADFGQMYTDLAILSLLWGHESSGYLARLWEASWMHHAADVCNQIHTVQVGLYDFFVDAKLESLQEELFSLFGLLRDREDFIGIGKQILTNHHLLSEQVFERALRKSPGDARPEATRALEAIGMGDPTLEAEIARALEGDAIESTFGKAIIETIVVPSSKEAPEIYRLARTFAIDRLRQAGGKYDETQEPEPFVSTSAEAQAALHKFLDVAGHGFARAGSGFRAWEAQFDKVRAAIPARVKNTTEIAPRPAAPTAGGPEAPEWANATIDRDVLAAHEQAVAMWEEDQKKPKGPPPSGYTALSPAGRALTDRVVSRMVRQLLAYHKEAQQRRDAWEPKAPNAAAGARTRLPVVR